MISLSAGPFEIKVNLDPRFSYCGTENLTGFSKGKDTPLFSLQVEIAAPEDEFGVFVTDSELALNWRVENGKGKQRVQFWCDDEKRFSLEAKFSENFSKLELRSLKSTDRNLNLSFLLSSALKWMVIHRLPIESGFMLHGACLGMGGKAWVATGPSGAGKSTLSSFFLDRDGFEVFSDETVILVQRDQKWLAFGTPWCGMLGVAHNSGLPLERLLFIEKAKDNQISSISSRETFRRIWSEVFVPPAQDSLADLTLEHLQLFLQKFNGDILAFRKDDSIVEYVSEVS